MSFYNSPILFIEDNNEVIILTIRHYDDNLIEGFNVTQLRKMEADECGAYIDHPMVCAAMDDREISFDCMSGLTLWISTPETGCLKRSLSSFGDMLMDFDDSAPDIQAIPHNNILPMGDTMTDYLKSRFNAVTLINAALAMTRLLENRSCTELTHYTWFTPGNVALHSVDGSHYTVCSLQTLRDRAKLTRPGHLTIGAAKRIAAEHRAISSLSPDKLGKLLTLVRITKSDTENEENLFIYIDTDNQLYATCRLVDPAAIWSGSLRDSSHVMEVMRTALRPHRAIVAAGVTDINSLPGHMKDFFNEIVTKDKDHPGQFVETMVSGILRPFFKVKILTVGTTIN